MFALKFKFEDEMRVFNMTDAALEIDISYDDVQRQHMIGVFDILTNTITEHELKAFGCAPNLKDGFSCCTNYLNSLKVFHYVVPSIDLDKMSIGTMSGFLKNAKNEADDVWNSVYCGNSDHFNKRCHAAVKHIGNGNVLNYFMFEVVSPLVIPQSYHYVS